MVIYYNIYSIFLVGIEAGRFYSGNLNGEAIPIHLLYERSEIGCVSARSVPELKQILDTKIFDLLKDFLVRERKTIHIEAFLARRALVPGPMGLYSLGRGTMKLLFWFASS